MAIKHRTWFKAVYRPLPMGLMFAFISALGLLWGAWNLAGWQAREAERSALQALHDQASESSLRFYTQLYGSLQTLEAVPLQRCTAAGLAQLHDLRRHLLNQVDPLSGTAGNMMNPTSATTDSGLLAFEALEAFQNHPKKIGEMPVVEGGALKGLLVLKDLLRSGIV